MFRRDGASDGGSERSVPPRYGFKGAESARKGELSYQKWRRTSTAAFPSQRKRVLAVIRCRLEGVVGGKFIDRVRGIDEFGDRRRSLEVRDALSLHDVLD